MAEVEGLQRARIECALRVDELQLIARALNERRASLGAHTDPVDRTRHRQRAVRLDSDLESCFVQRRDQSPVHLQHGLAARQYHERRRARIALPSGATGFCQLIGVREFAAARTVGAYEIRVAEIASRRGAVLLAA